MTVLTRTQEPTTSRRKIWPFSSNHHQKVKTIEIDGERSIRSVAFLVDGGQFLSGGVDGKIRCWRVEDGEEVGMPIDAWSTVCTIAVSRDGKWVVSGTNSGRVTVWNAENHEKAIGLAGHEDWVRAVDVSPDASRIATGSYDKTACVWSLSTGERILGPLQHDWSLAAVKFSPDGRLIATATWCRTSIRIYDNENGRLLIDFPIQVSSSENQSLAWASDSKQLFALSRDGNINHLDVDRGAMLSQWPIHRNNNYRCIALTSDCQFIAASAGSSVSFWDTTTHEQIGSVIEHIALVVSMAISEKYDIVIGGGQQITLRNIYDVLHSSCSEDSSTFASKVDKLLCRLLQIFPEQARRTKVEKAHLEEISESPRIQVDDSGMFIGTDLRFIEINIRQMNKNSEPPENCTRAVSRTRQHPQRGACRSQRPNPRACKSSSASIALP